MLTKLSGRGLMALVAVLASLFDRVDVSTKAIADRLQRFKEARWFGLSFRDAWEVSARPAVSGGADAVTTYSAVSADALSYYITEKMISLAQRRMVLQGQTQESLTLLDGMGKTLRINRYKRMNNPTATLTEGTPPDAVALEVESVDTTVEQWGLVGLLTDVAEVTIKHPLLSMMMDRTSRAISETRERETAQVLLGGTNVFYAGGQTSRGALTSSHKLTTADCMKITALLRDNGADDWGGLMIGYLTPQVEADIMGDTTFANAASYSQVVRLNNQEIGTYGGIRWSWSNFLPKFAGVGAPGTQSASVSGYANEAGAGAGIGGAKLTVVSKDKQSGYERKISQEKSVTAGKDTAELTTPTSTNYVYDIYQTNTSGAAYKRVFTDVPANTLKTISATTYTNGTTRTPTTTPGSGAEVFIAFIFGKEGYGDVQLSGMSMQSYVTPPGASYSNPLAQGRKVGNKYMAKPTILDNNFFARFESGSAQSANLPA